MRVTGSRLLLPDIHIQVWMHPTYFYDVCHKAIKAFPDCPKIRKDILEKARIGLKTVKSRLSLFYC